MYTYYSGHKGVVVAAENVSAEIMEQYIIKEYKYVVIDGIAAVTKMKNTFPDILIKYKRLFSTDDLIIFNI